MLLEALGRGWAVKAVGGGSGKAAGAGGVAEDGGGEGVFACFALAEAARAREFVFGKPGGEG